MRKHLFLSLLLLIPGFFFVSAQQSKIDSIKFFADVKPIEMTLSTDIRKLIADKMKMTAQPGTITLHLPDDTTTFTGDITIRARGITRKESCNMPPTYIDFNNSSPTLKPLNKLKLVSGCNTAAEDERLALKEYLAYKIYNLITDMSFRVRLAHITYQDSRGKAKSYSQYGYFIEEIKATAKRNHCKEIKNKPFPQERTNRQQMTLVSLFEYMIGNTDWSTLNYHNIKLIEPKKELTAPPYAVPYDFDYCGLVNAYYAVTSDVLGGGEVTERIYRGFPRSTEELGEAIEIFNKQKENIRNLVMNFEPIPTKHRKDMMEYIESFYKIINDKKAVQEKFITEARTN